ncbi:protein OPI10 homolog isoform X2 [Diachasma alloeum]|nr:protein OPI10 homolog isoform X2 [Diachasma alloeum]
MNQNQFLITVPDADNVNHVVVFLTGSIPFPEGTGGAGLWWGTLLVTPVKYIKTGCCRCPTPAGLSLSINNEVDQLAMAMTLSILDLCNLESRKNHPLPVYFSWPDPDAPPNWQFLGYISNLKPSAIFKIMNLRKNHEFENTNDGIFGIGKISHVAQIGISIEPLNVIESQANAIANAVADVTRNSSMEFAQKMLTSFLNYISSFSVTQSQMTPNPTENFVPLSSVQGWYEKFERRLQQNPNFWRQL